MSVTCLKNIIFFCQSDYDSVSISMPTITQERKIAESYSGAKMFTFSKIKSLYGKVSNVSSQFQQI